MLIVFEFILLLFRIEIIIVILINIPIYILYIKIGHVGKSKTGSSGSGPKRKLLKALERCRKRPERSMVA